MQRDARAFLWDVRRSADAIARYIDHRDRDGYLADDMLRSAVERQFEIIGEALNQLSQAGSGHCQSHPRTRECRAFRNILIHGYTQVDSMIVWETITGHLPALRERVAALLAEFDAAS